MTGGMRGKWLGVCLLGLGLLGMLAWGLGALSLGPSISDRVQASAPRVTRFSDTVIPLTDLPPAGTRSLFDHLVAQNDVLPYPFEKLLGLLAEGGAGTATAASNSASAGNDPDAAPPVTLMVPNGRSLLKGQADAAHPRVLAAADFQAKNPPTGLGLAPRGQVFLGFVENAHEIEVLSYNEAAGRFEFQLVQNYCAGCVPRIVYARRAICTTCHQGAAPIFSQRPWNETNGQPAVAHAIALARGSADYQGVAVVRPLAAPERFDQLTDVGNFHVATQRLWLDGCGPRGNDCRRQMLLLALDYLDQPGRFDATGAEAGRLKALQAKTFPAEGVAVPESDLFNRDPLGEKQGLKGWWHGLFTRDIRFGEGARTNEDLGAFDRLPPLPARLDPLTVRPPKQVLHASDVDGVYGLAAFFTTDDLQTLETANGQDIARVKARVAALPDAAFAPRPFSRVAWMRLILDAPTRDYCCLDTSAMSPPVASGVPPLRIVAHPELKPFAENCFACHRGNPAARLNFMAGATEDETLANIKAKTEIREVLDWERFEGTEKAAKLMPPRDSVQYQKLKAAGPETRRKMRETVPSLFDFG